jgi:hypothetical protein
VQLVHCIQNLKVDLGDALLLARERVREGKSEKECERERDRFYSQSSRADAARHIRGGESV